jgi:1-deoxy-D-xylulose-5-phosphate synthase
MVDMRFVKPLDEQLLHQLAQTHDAFVTIEEGSIMGGAGSAVLEYFSSREIVCAVLQLGLSDQFIDHGEQTALLKSLGLDASGIENAIRERFPVVHAQGKCA